MEYFTVFLGMSLFSLWILVLMPVFIIIAGDGMVEHTLYHRNGIWSVQLVLLGLFFWVHGAEELITLMTPLLSWRTGLVPFALVLMLTYYVLVAVTNLERRAYSCLKTIVWHLYGWTWTITKFVKTR